MKRFLTFATLVFISITSCTITQDFYFNEDFSGHTELIIDQSLLLSMYSGLDSIEDNSTEYKDSIGLVLDEVAKKLNYNGISNLKYGWTEEDGTYSISYGFSDLDVLNRSMNTLDDLNSFLETSADNHVYFEKKGKNVYFKMKKAKEEVKDDEDTESMKAFYTYEERFHFSNEIKKVDHDSVKISEDRRDASLTNSMFDMAKPSYKSDIIFKLK